MKKGDFFNQKTTNFLTQNQTIFEHKTKIIFVLLFRYLLKSLLVILIIKLKTVTLTPSWL